LIIRHGLIRFKFGENETPKTGGGTHSYNVIVGKVVDATLEQFYKKYSTNSIYDVEYFKEDGFTPYNQ